MTDPAFSCDPLPSAAPALQARGSKPVAGVTARLRFTLHRVEVGPWTNRVKRLQLKIAQFVVVDTTDEAIGRELIGSHLVLLLDGKDRDHLLRALEPPAVHQ